MRDVTPQVAYILCTGMASHECIIHESFMSLRLQHDNETCATSQIPNETCATSQIPDETCAI
jgi:hypothetical protein